MAKAMPQAAEKILALRTIESWHAEIDRQRQLKLAELKNLKQEERGLSKRRHQLITDDQQELFPGGDLQQPDCLKDNGTCWTLIRKKDLLVRVFKMEPLGEPAVFFIFMSQTPGQLNQHDVVSIGGETKEAAVKMAAQGVKREYPQYAKLVDKLLQECKPPVPLIDPTAALPQIALHECSETDGKPLYRIPSPFGESKPRVFLHGDDELMIVTAPEESSGAWSVATALPVEPLDDWTWATAKTPAAAFDGHFFGVKVKSQLGEGVLGSWDKAVRIVAIQVDNAHFYTEVDVERPVTASTFNGLWDTFGKKLARQISEAQPIDPSMVFFRDDERYLLAGPSPLIPDGAMAMLRLLTVEDFQQQFPNFEGTAEPVAGWDLAMFGAEVTFGETKWAIAPMKLMRAVSVTVAPASKKSDRKGKPKKGN